MDPWIPDADTRTMSGVGSHPAAATAMAGLSSYPSRAGPGDGPGVENAFAWQPDGRSEGSVKTPHTNMMEQHVRWKLVPFVRSRTAFRRKDSSSVSTRSGLGHDRAGDFRRLHSHSTVLWPDLQARHDSVCFWQFVLCPRVSAGPAGQETLPEKTVAQCSPW